jgi:hypothetical protein
VSNKEFDAVAPSDFVLSVEAVFDSLLSCSWAIGPGEAIACALVDGVGTATAGDGVDVEGTVSFLEKKESSPDDFLTSAVGAARDLGLDAGPASVSNMPHPCAMGLMCFFTDSSHDVDPRRAWNLARGLDCATAECLVNFNAVIDDL